MSENSDSDSSIEMPRPMRRVKEIDPDWDEDIKPPIKKLQRVKKELADSVDVKPKVKREAATNKRVKKVKNEIDGVDIKPKIKREPVSKKTLSKVKNETNNADIKPKIEFLKEGSPDSVNLKSKAKSGLGRSGQAKAESDVVVKKQLKRKNEDSENTAPKKVKSSAEPSGSGEVDNRLDWEASVVARHMNCSPVKARDLIQMLTEGATVPFLIRYRKNVVGDWSPSEMRVFTELHQSAKELVTRAIFVRKKIDAKGHLNSELSRAISQATTMHELDDIYEPYKPAKTASKLAVVRDLGLDSVADDILRKQNVDLWRLVNTANEHTKTIEDVKILLITAIADTMSQKLKENTRLWSNTNWTIQSTKIAKGKVEDDKENFKKYYDFQRPANYVRSDEVLAMNRGAKKKILKVSLVPRGELKKMIGQSIANVFGLNWLPHSDMGDVLRRAIEMAQEKSLAQISKRIRTDGTKSAEVSAIEVFSANLKRLLLTPPFRAEREFHVLGIDPGYRNGCKIVVVSSKSLAVEESAIFHLNGRGYPYEFEKNLEGILSNWGVETIVLGNGVGSQDVESVINKIVQRPQFARTRYTIVPEQGVSVYSCSEEAQREYPNFKPEVVSSLSLVKRFFNPLHEYVKVDPKHLGIGMYQHDIDDKKLTEALQGTVSEIVSVVGVDLNTASLPLLKSVAGLTETRAKAIVARRDEIGPFTNRKQLLDLKGLGPKTYQQCAGFVRIIPPPGGRVSGDYNLLDQTIVHPEHYSATNKLIRLIGLCLDDIGSSGFIDAVNQFASRHNLTETAEHIQVDVDTTKLLMHALSMPLDQDIRTLAQPPEFKSRLLTLNQLRSGLVVTGRVENVTSFGAFVDIGVGVSGLLYFTSYSRPDVGLGDKIEVQIEKLEVDRERIGLSFKRKIADLFPMSKLV